MTDDRELAGLDPFALLDTEAGRLDAFLSGLGEAGWQRASRCAGWTVRDVLGHLAAGEDYHRACLDGTVAAFLAGFAERGGTDLDSVNALGVADHAALSPAEVLARWRAASADNRHRFRERADGVVDTSVGDYPSRWQAFHVAAELATHGDDIACPSRMMSMGSGQHGGPATPGSRLRKRNPSCRSGMPARGRLSPMGPAP